MRILSNAGVTWRPCLPYRKSMTKSLIAGLLLATAAPVFAQASPAHIASLREAALKDDIAYEIVEGLTTEVGPRLAGTEAEARAR